MKIQFFLKYDISFFVFHLTIKTIKVSLNNSLKKKQTLIYRIINPISHHDTNEKQIRILVH